MKTLILLGALLLGAAGARAGEPGWEMTSLESTYSVVNDTVALSSTTATLMASSGRFRKVCLGDPSTTVNIFYRFDGTTTSVTTAGWWIPAGTGQCVESNNQFAIQLPAGASAVTVRRVTITK